MIPDMCWEIHFARAAGLYVSMHKLLPKGAYVLAGVPGPGRPLRKRIRIGCSVALSVHCEFESLQAVVLRQKGHEGAKRVRRQRRVGENLP